MRANNNYKCMANIYEILSSEIECVHIKHVSGKLSYSFPT